mmetsp:Transcript_16010/g.24596  ORF Transcript_16010/g.24596 Transcript_16010/m.24596 type:complete len:330 (-) Transcript_16010:417-1406(-)
MTVRSCFVINWSSQFQCFADHSWPQIKILINGGINSVHRHFLGAIRVHKHRQWFRHTNRIRQLHQTASTKIRRHQRLGNPSCCVRRRSIHFRRVFAREGTATMCAPSAIRVHNDFSASETSVAVRTANHESTTRIQMENGVGGQVSSWHHILDHVLQQVRFDLFIAHAILVLRRDQNSVHALWHHASIHIAVHHRHLRLAIRAHPLQNAFLAHVRQSLAKFGRQNVRQWHQFWRLIRRVSKHNALIACAQVFVRFGQMTVHRLRNVGRLLLNRDNHIASLVVNALLRGVIANILDSFANHRFIVHLGRGRDFTKYHHHASFGRGLASDI